MKLFQAAIVLLVTLLVSLNALACGDSLYRVGKGVSYRVYTAPLPGSVLVYGQSNAVKQLAEALAQSGHGVQLVENEADLAQEIGQGNYDVVIAAFSERDSVEASRQGSTTDFIPVTVSDEEEVAAKQSYRQVLVADRSDIKHYLKAIHRSLKSAEA